MLQQYINKYRTLSVKSVDDKIYEESVDNIITNNGNVTFETPVQPAQESVTIPSTDHDYKSSTTSRQRILQTELGISDSGLNIFTGPQIVASSDRILLNAKQDYLLAFSKKGIALASAGPVNIDSAEEVTLAPIGGVYIGPGTTPGEKTSDQKATNAPQDQQYEPMILGNKLANLLEDFLLIISRLKVATPQGEGYVSAETQKSIQQLIARIPEMLSSYGFITGTKHESIPGPIPNQTAPEVIEQTASTPFGDSIPSGSVPSRFVHPLNGAGTVTSVPGNRVNPVTGLPQNHGGLDIAAPRGTPVFAMADGVVLRTNNSCLEGDKQCGGGLGNYVVIKHEGEIEAKYGHMSTGTVLVLPGQPVRKGDQIGTVGNTGASSGPHLHVQMKALPGSEYIAKAIPDGDVHGRLNPLDFFST